jgi:hypothetical protein
LCVLYKIQNGTIVIYISLSSFFFQNNVVSDKKRRLTFENEEEDNREPDLVPDARKPSLTRLFVQISSGSVEMVERPTKHDAMARLAADSLGGYIDEEGLCLGGDEEFVNEKRTRMLFGDDDDCEEDEFFFDRKRPLLKTNKVAVTPRITNTPTNPEFDFEEPEDFGPGEEVVCHIVPQECKNVRGRGPSLADLGLPVLYSRAEAPPLSPTKEIDLFMTKKEGTSELTSEVDLAEKHAQKPKKSELEKIFF